MATTVPKLRYLSAWFCPYAHRATIALEHHSALIDYEWVEVRSIIIIFKDFFPHDDMIGTNMIVDTYSSFMHE